ncbi:hypothetical protein MHY30_00885 [Microbacterium sp. ACRRU]|uniref:hypothetical protein n=1 Tax=Microbacterium sp. ACRRU TaxID=2918204 RepID=UPI001EF48AD0|nr:hypothetical protein [Microbacterium sp. ACRRU]MCG7416067.1 hypothetical protein [Microbacterium sp. ACRRU]
MTLVTLSNVPSVTIDPSALSAAAESLRHRADAAADSAERITATWNALPASYDAPEAAELLARMSVVPRAADDFVETFRRIAAIMTELADQLALARAQETSLRAEIESFRDAVRGYRTSSDEMGIGSTEDTWGPGQFAHNQELIAACLSLRSLRDAAIEEARRDLASISQPDIVLSSSNAVGTSPSSTAWTTEYDALADGVAFAILAKLSAGTADDALALLAAHDDWRRLFASNPPDATAVNAWWTQLAASNPGALDSLVLGASVIVGSLGGVPPANRVAANAVNAKNRIPLVEAEIRRMSELSLAHGGPDFLAWRDVIGRLERQLDYLQRAADGDVQLYLYEPDSQSIIEMIGTLDVNTTDVITYVPGTFTSVHSFYGDQVQQVGRWLRTNDPRVVTFVWKEGLFPGEDVVSGAMDFARIVEANDQGAALDTGRLIADFQHELLSSSSEAAAAEQGGMGHSWGLGGISSSEVAGAKYAQVHSLAGAGLPSAWTPSSSTEYFHWGYTDALSIVQGTGAVWDGRVPTREGVFESHVYVREGDFTLYIPSGASSRNAVIAPVPPASIPLTTTPIENHNLIASDNPENQTALFHMLREIER